MSFCRPYYNRCSPVRTCLYLMIQVYLTQLSFHHTSHSKVPGMNVYACATPRFFHPLCHPHNEFYQAPLFLSEHYSETDKNLGMRLKQPSFSCHAWSPTIAHQLGCDQLYCFLVDVTYYSLAIPD